MKNKKKRAWLAFTDWVIYTSIMVILIFAGFGYKTWQYWVILILICVASVVNYYRGVLSEREIHDRYEAHH